MKKHLLIVLSLFILIGCGRKPTIPMKEPTSYSSLKSKGVDNYIQLLKDHGIYKKVVQRLKRKNTAPPDELIAQLFTRNDIGLSSYLFSDFYYDLDGFYESFGHNIQTALETSFSKKLEHFKVTNIYYHRRTKEFLGEVVSRTEKSGLLAEDFEKSNNWMSVSDPIFKIQATVNSELFEYEWSNWEHGSKFLKKINTFNEVHKLKGRWYPLPSEYSDFYIFTTLEEYNLIKKLFLIVPEGYKSDKMEYPVNYSRKLQ